MLGSYSNFEPKLRGPNQNWKLLEMKMTSNGRQPQNIKSWISQFRTYLQPLKESWISQQPMIRSYSNFKLKLGDQNKIEKCYKRRQLQMEDDIKRLKVEYLSCHWSDHPQILNLNQKLLEMKMTSDRRQPQNIKSGISQFRISLRPLKESWISQQPMILLKF
jgi:hypothetical protein